MTSSCAALAGFPEPGDLRRPVAVCAMGALRNLFQYNKIHGFAHMTGQLLVTRKTAGRCPSAVLGRPAACYISHCRDDTTTMAVVECSGWQGNF